MMVLVLVPEGNMQHSHLCLLLHPSGIFDVSLLRWDHILFGSIPMENVYPLPPQYVLLVLVPPKGVFLFTLQWKIPPACLFINIWSKCFPSQSGRQACSPSRKNWPCTCYMLFKESACQNEMFPNPVPEIWRTNLGNVVLLLKFPWSKTCSVLTSWTLDPWRIRLGK